MANMNKVQEILSNEDNMYTFLTLKTPEEAMAYLNEQGAELKEDDMMTVINSFVVGVNRVPSDKMDLDDMENVAGGVLREDTAEKLMNVTEELCDLGSRLIIPCGVKTAANALEDFGNYLDKKGNELMLDAAKSMAEAWYVLKNTTFSRWFR